MSQVRGIADLGIFPVFGQPNLNIKVDRDKAARYGLNTGDVNTVIQAAMGGATATQVLEGDREWNLGRAICVRRSATTSTKSATSRWAMPQHRRQRLRAVEELATIKLDTGALMDLPRDHATGMIPVKFSVRGRDLGGTVAEAQARIKKNVHLPSGYRIIWAGEFEDLQLAKERLEVIVPGQPAAHRAGCSTPCSIRGVIALWR